MSRTRKDRPYWVRSNDPKERRSEVHNHLRQHREKVGEEKYIHTPAHTVRDEYGRFLCYVPEYSWMVNVYKRWVEVAECNVNEPITRDPRWREGCKFYAEDVGYGWPRHAAKTAVSQARRHNMRQELHTMLLYGDWDLDINENPLYSKNRWWD